MAEPSVLPNPLYETGTVVFEQGSIKWVLVNPYEVQPQPVDTSGGVQHSFDIDGVFYPGLSYIDSTIQTTLDVVNTFIWHHRDCASYIRRVQYQPKNGPVPIMDYDEVGHYTKITWRPKTSYASFMSADDSELFRPSRVLQSQNKNGSGTNAYNSYFSPQFLSVSAAIGTNSAAAATNYCNNFKLYLDKLDGFLAAHKAIALNQVSQLIITYESVNKWLFTSGSQTDPSAAPVAPYSAGNANIKSLLYVAMETDPEVIKLIKNKFREGETILCPTVIKKMKAQFNNGAAIPAGTPVSQIVRFMPNDGIRIKRVWNGVFQGAEQGATNFNNAAGILGSLYTMWGPDRLTIQTMNIGYDKVDANIALPKIRNQFLDDYAQMKYRFKGSAVIGAGGFSECSFWCDDFTQMRKKEQAAVDPDEDINVLEGKEIENDATYQFNGTIRSDVGATNVTGPVNYYCFAETLRYLTLKDGGVQIS